MASNQMPSSAFAYLQYDQIRAVDPHSFYTDPDPGPGPGPDPALKNLKKKIMKSFRKL